MNEPWPKATTTVAVELEKRVWQDLLLEWGLEAGGWGRNLDLNSRTRK